MSARLAWAALAFALGACAGGGPAPRVYDLGEPGAAPALARVQGSGAARVYAQVVAPPWLDSPAILYRLDYDDPQRVREYAQSRWADAPARLLQQRLRARLGLAATVPGPAAGGETGALLRVDLDEFDQVFGAAQASRARLHAQATLIELPGGRLRAQRVFEIERETVPPDAVGAVHGLGAVADDFADALGTWLREHQPDGGTTAR